MSALVGIVKTVRRHAVSQRPREHQSETTETQPMRSRTIFLHDQGRSIKPLRSLSGTRSGACARAPIYPIFKPYHLENHLTPEHPNIRTHRRGNSIARASSHPAPQANLERLSRLGAFFGLQCYALGGPIQASSIRTSCYAVMERTPPPLLHKSHSRICHVPSVASTIQVIGSAHH